MKPLLASFPEPIHVLVVGGSGGIGQSFIRQLLANEQVSKVYSWSRTATTVTNQHLHHSMIDYADEISIKKATEAITAPLQLVIVATGFLHGEHGQKTLRPEKSFKQINADNFARNMLVNTLGPALVAKYVLPKMSTESKSVFSVLSARVGSISDNRLGGWYSYRASKAALNMMIKTLAIEWRRTHPQGILVGLHPGTVDTSLSQPFQRNVAPEKLFSSDYSAECLLSVIDQLQASGSGDCFAWDGKKVPA